MVLIHGDIEQHTAQHSCGNVIFLYYSMLADSRTLRDDGGMTGVSLLGMRILHAEGVTKAATNNFPIRLDVQGGWLEVWVGACVE